MTSQLFCKSVKYPFSALAACMLLSACMMFVPLPLPRAHILEKNGNCSLSEISEDIENTYWIGGGAPQTIEEAAFSFEERAQISLSGIMAETLSGAQELRNVECNYLVQPYHSNTGEAFGSTIRISVSLNATTRFICVRVIGQTPKPATCTYITGE